MVWGLPKGDGISASDEVNEANDDDEDDDDEEELDLESVW